jgi:hypothetical protein
LLTIRIGIPDDPSQIIVFTANGAFFIRYGKQVSVGIIGITDCPGGIGILSNPARRIILIYGLLSPSVDNTGTSSLFSLYANWILLPSSALQRRFHFNISIEIKKGHISRNCVTDPSETTSDVLY